MTALYGLTLAINVIWFGLAFHFFGLRPHQAVKLLTTRAAASETSREALIGSLRFLGGMNLAMAALSAAQLIIGVGGAGAGHLSLFVASTVAHASQFAGNVPFAWRGGRGGGAPWDVLRGPMAFIFVVDLLCALLNGAMVVLAWSAA
jgi:hypothetical protein